MSQESIRFDGQVALVTGAGKGIGRAHAERLAARGCAVVVNNRRRPDAPDSAEEVAAAIRASGGRAVADYESVEQDGAGARMVAHAVAAFGALDILIANAGTSLVRPFHKTTPEEMRSLVEVNVLGTLSPVRAALDEMRPAGHGAILVTASTAGLFGDVGFAAYAAAKAMTQGLVPSLAAEGRRVGVRVNAVAPFVYTQMTEWIFEGGHYPREVAEELGPNGVADLALWLVSRGCTLSGETLVAGGRVFARAEMRTSPGIEIDEKDVSPEVFAERYAEIADMDGSRAYGQGGDLLRSIVERTMRRGAKA